VRGANGQTVVQPTPSPDEMTARIVYPKPGAVLTGGGFTFKAEVTGTVRNVQFFVNGALFKDDTVSPWMCGPNAATLPNGTVVLMVRAFDVNGRFVEHTINVVAQ
jgi:hypothetical protein